MCESPEPLTAVPELRVGGWGECLHSAGPPPLSGQAVAAVRCNLRLPLLRPVYFFGRGSEKHPESILGIFYFALTDRHAYVVVLAELVQINDPSHLCDE